MEKPHNGLYIMLLSVHGLVRGHELELGRDADTGGQIKYVVELAKALGKHPDVSRVDLVTRQVIDSKVDASYAEPFEALSSNVSIIRLPCGPRRYLRKEVLWSYLDSMVDNILQHIRKVRQVPDIVHSHYADAGYVGSRLVQLLGVPSVFTGHSLGRVKLQRLLEQGSKESSIENQYNISARIEAEEITLGNSSLVITSTHQEVEEQYSVYDNYQPRRMMVIPPGVDLGRFHPQRRFQIHDIPIKEQLDKFLTQPKKPIILAISRPDERKNIATLIKVFGENEKLRELANLIIIAGNRDDINSMEKGPREVLNNILLLIDYYDLYGKVAYPKHHNPDDIADLFRLAQYSRGVFVNPALTEPFGLTLIEAAASGLPLVATEDGGPRDIIAACDNGILIDPLDPAEIADAIFKVLSDKAQWQKWSKNGAKGAYQHFSWENHVDKYIKTINKAVKKSRRVTDINISKKNRLPVVDRLIVCDIDNTLLGDDDGLRDLLNVVRSANGKIGLAVATGRRIDSAIKILKKHQVPVPDLLITAVGSEIHYGYRLIEDPTWNQHTEYRWRPEALRNIMSMFPGLKLQSASEQRNHKISYLVDLKKAPSMREISAQLRKRDLHAKIIFSHQAYLDLLPVRASKGLAVRYISIKWGIPPERILVAGDSGNDEEMLRGNTLGVVVGNYSSELSRLKGKPNIYFANGEYSKGILEGMQHYGFLHDLTQTHSETNKVATEEISKEASHA